jgi:hypothetical protein
MSTPPWDGTLVTQSVFVQAVRRRDADADQENAQGVRGCRSSLAGNGIDRLRR